MVLLYEQGGQVVTSQVTRAFDPATTKSPGEPLTRRRRPPVANSNPTVDVDILGPTTQTAIQVILQVSETYPRSTHMVYTPTSSAASH